MVLLKHGRQCSISYEWILIIERRACRISGCNLGMVGLDEGWPSCSWTLQTGLLDLVRTCNLQACLRSPSPAAIILLDPCRCAQTYTRPLRVWHSSSPHAGIVLEWHHICPHALLTEQTHTYQTDLLMRGEDRQMSVWYQLMLCHGTFRPEAKIYTEQLNQFYYVHNFKICMTENHILLLAILSTPLILRAWLVKLFNKSLYKGTRISRSYCCHILCGLLCW